MGHHPGPPAPPAKVDMFKVTVAICCYKQKEWLHRCLRSLCNQTLPKNKFEVIVVDDDPTDSGLEDIVENAAAYINIRLLKNKQNLGLPGSLNKILRKSLGQYFVRVDADDYVSKHYLYMLSTFLDMNSGPRVMDTKNNYQAVACDYFKVDDTGKLLSRHSSEQEMIACGIMFTYESLCAIGLYNEEFKMREGHDLLRRYKERFNLYNLPLPLYKYRMHENNRTKDEVRKEYDELIALSP